jgi:hypothetical protein
MKHPYAKFEKTAMWNTVEKALAELETNNDLKITTKPEYVIGFICQQLSIKSSSKGKRTSG